MTTPPRLILPQNAMPWGRWVQQNVIETAQSLNDIGSGGAEFTNKADNIAQQIKGIQVASIALSQPPGFNASVTGGISDPVRNVLSPVYSFSAPDALQTSCQVIVNFRITATSGEAPDWTIMQVNGNSFSDVSHDVRRPPFVNTQGYYAAQGKVELTPGQTVNVQFGAKAQPLPNSNLVFDSIYIWLAFYGRIR